MKTSELLNKLNEDLSDEDFDKFLLEIEKRMPFEDFYVTLSEIEGRICKLEGENEGLRELIRSHVHVGNKVMIEA